MTYNGRPEVVQLTALAIDYDPARGGELFNIKATDIPDRPNVEVNGLNLKGVMGYQLYLQNDQSPAGMHRDAYK